MAVIVRAARAHREEATAGFDDRHFVVADRAFDSRVIGEAAEWNASGQIGKVARLRIGHDDIMEEAVMSASGNCSMLELRVQDASRPLEGILPPVVGLNIRLA